MRGYPGTSQGEHWGRRVRAGGVLPNGICPITERQRLRGDGLQIGGYDHRNDGHRLDLERFHNSHALCGAGKGASFLMKKALEGCGFWVQQLWNRCRILTSLHPSWFIQVKAPHGECRPGRG